MRSTTGALLLLVAGTLPLSQPLACSATTAPAQAPAPVLAAPVPATRPRDTPEADLRRLAEERRISAFQLVREAQEAERAGRTAEARNLYIRALELDVRNAAARDGRDRVAAILEEAAKQVPRQRGRSDRRIMGSSTARYDFNTAVEEADKAIASKEFHLARAAWHRARAAAVREPEFFPPEQIEAFRRGLRELERRIADAETAEIEHQRRAGRHEAVARIQAERKADVYDRAKIVRDLVKKARQSIEEREYVGAQSSAEEILLLDAQNDFALGIRPLLREVGRLRFELHRVTGSSTAPSTRPTLGSP